MNKKEFFNGYTLVFSILLIGSFIGFAHENILTLIKGQYVLRQGLLYEPLIPIYGLGAVFFYFSLYKPDLKKYDTLMIVVGPEGGFTLKEEETLINNGFISTSLGKRVLRTETAGMVAISMINYEWMV